MHLHSNRLRTANGLTVVFFHVVAITCALSPACKPAPSEQPAPSAPPTKPAATSVAKGAPLVPWSSDEGQKRLAESKHKKDFFRLANHFESQENRIFCGPATAAIVLNALRVRNGDRALPRDPSLLTASDRTHLPKRDGWFPTYDRYTQNNVFAKSPKTRAQVLGAQMTDKAGNPMTKDDGSPVRDYGFQLRQLAALLEGNGAHVDLRVLDDDAKDATVIKEIADNLAEGDNYVIANYTRKVLNQPGSGHISPVGAYHQPSNSLLILDVTPNKADWMWVDATVFVAAMRTHDTIENRGYLLVREGQ